MRMPAYIFAGLVSCGSFLLAACDDLAPVDAYETEVQARTKVCLEKSEREARESGTAEAEISEGRDFVTEMCRDIAISQIAIDEANAAQAAITDSIIQEAEDMTD